LVRAGHQVLISIKLTYAGDLSDGVTRRWVAQLSFEQMDILDQCGIGPLLSRTSLPKSVFHLAAETMLDRSSTTPAKFIDTNLHGTFVMLQTALAYWNELDTEERGALPVY